MTLRSRSVQDYFEVPFSSLKAGKVISFDAHFYFKSNDHLILIVKAGETLSQSFLDRYANRGASKVWIHHHDKPTYDLYCEEDKQSLEGLFISETLKNEVLTPEEKSSIVSEVASLVLAETKDVQTPQEQTALDHKAAQVVADVIADAMKKRNPILQDIWQLAKVQPELEHSLNVGIYSALFALAFGKIDTDLLADIAMAGLLHDVGISQVDFSIVSQAWTTHDERDSKKYAAHVDFGSEILTLYSKAVPDRVREIMGQHHEKFDGSGYPNKLKGFAFDDVAQLVGIADLVDSISLGQWDGTPRTAKESFQILEGFEKEKSFPVYFNPDVFSHVLHWVTGTQIDESMPTEAMAVVQKDLETLIK